MKTPSGRLIKLLILTVLAMISVYSITVYMRQSAHGVTIKDAKEKLRLNKYDIVLDVRTQLEYTSGHYPNSLNISSESITEEEVIRHIPNKNTSILVYCKTGRRARNVSEMLLKMGYNNVEYITDSYTHLL